MQLKKIEIKNIRNITYKNINLTKNNLIIGKNGTGKTTIAECIYFSCFGKSFKTTKSRELINFNNDSATIHVYYEQENKINNIQINFYKNEKKIFHNNKEIKNIYELLNKFKCILITPNNIDLINDNPNKRRKYLNIFLSQQNNNYLKDLVAYNKLIKIKNLLLKQYLKTKKIDKIYLEILNKQINQLNKTITDKRINILQKLEININIIYRSITQEQNEIKLNYQIKSNQIDLETLNQNELTYGKILKGNHLDNIQFLLNQKDAKIFASQGQKRLLTLCFFLAQKNLDLKNENEYLIIFDDVSIDLDSNKQKNLINYLQNLNQSIYISTDILKLLINDKNQNLNIINMP